MIDVSN